MDPDFAIDLEAVGYYVLDGIPVKLRSGGVPLTAYGQAVDWGEWLYRAVRISADEYEDLVRQITPPDVGLR